MYPPQQLDTKKFCPVVDFLVVSYIYNKHYNNNNDNSNNKDNNKEKTMKRTYRNDMPQTQRAKIAQANTGKHLSDETRRKISQALTDYWAGLPFKPVTATASTSGTTTTPPTATPNPYQ